MDFEDRLMVGTGWMDECIDEWINRGLDGS